MTAISSAARTLHVAMMTSRHTHHAPTQRVAERPRHGGRARRHQRRERVAAPHADLAPSRRQAQRRRTLPRLRSGAPQSTGCQSGRALWL